MKVDHLLSLLRHVLQLVLTHRRPVTQERRSTGPLDPRGHAEAVLMNHSLYFLSLGKNNKEVLDLLSSGFRLPCPTRCPQNIYRMMMGCWAAEPSKRPSFHALHSQLDAIYARIYFKTIEV